MRKSMIPTLQRAVWMLALPLFLAGMVSGNEQVSAQADTLAKHETVAEFLGTKDHRCMGLTLLCPYSCGHSGTLAGFEIVNYITYEKLGEYGDPKCREFAFLLEDNMKNPRVSAAIRDAVSYLKQGDIVLLSWNHDYLTGSGVSRPERPITKLEKIAPVGTHAWLNQVDRRAGVSNAAGHWPIIGSAEWIQAVSVKLGVYDQLGHGPTPDSEEWRKATHWKAFGIKPPGKE